MKVINLKGSVPQTRGILSSFSFRFFRTRSDSVVRLQAVNKEQLDLVCKIIKRDSELPGESSFSVSKTNSKKLTVEVELSGDGSLKSLAGFLYTNGKLDVDELMKVVSLGSDQSARTSAQIS